MPSEGNRHIAEERNQVSLRDNDIPGEIENEEELYSNVIRDKAKNDQDKSWR